MNLSFVTSKAFRRRLTCEFYFQTSIRDVELNKFCSTASFIAKQIVKFLDSKENVKAAAPKGCKVSVFWQDHPPVCPHPRL